MPKDKIKFEKRTDGLYVILDNSDEAAKPSRKDLLEMIGEFQVDQVDINIINDIFKSTDAIVDRKISDRTDMVTKDESVMLEVVKDRLECRASFSAPEFGGKYLTSEQILTEIKKFGVNTGINPEAIAEVAALKDEKHYNHSYLVAEGVAPIDGEDGEVQYAFDVSEEASHPKILADGTVDYKQIDYFVSVRVSTVLATRTEPGEGTPGKDVFGHPVTQKPGRGAPKFVRAKGVYISEDELELIAQTSGQLVVNGKTISVSPLLEIKGDVGYETGNINFDGSVNVTGAVISGFKIEAAGNIEVKGVVEASTLKAGGSINLYGGVQGRSKGRIIAEGDVFCKFAQNAKLVAGGNIVSNSLLHCESECKGSIKLEGDNCFIAGGSATAGKEIRAKTIGSPMGTQTNLKVDGDPDVSDRFTETKKEYDELRAKYTKLNDDYERIIKSGDVTRLDVKHKSLLLQLINYRSSVKDQAIAMEKELTELMASMRLNKGRIVAEKIIHHGVEVQISNATKRLVDDITACVLRNSNGKITSEPNLGV